MANTAVYVLRYMKLHVSGFKQHRQTQHEYIWRRKEIKYKTIYKLLQYEFSYLAVLLFIL